MLKREREILHACRNVQAKVVDTALSGAGKYKVILEAPNGAQKPFFFSRDPSPRQAINEEKAVEHWVNENMPTPMAIAAAKAGIAKAMQNAREEQRPQLAVTFPQGKTPDAVKDDGTTLDLKTKETVMDTKTLKRPAIRKISQVDFFRLCQWVTKNIQDDEVITQVDIARRASEDLKIEVSAASIPAALEATGKKIKNLQAKGGSAPMMGKIQILARAILAIGSDKLSDELREQIKDLAL